MTNSYSLTDDGHLDAGREDHLEAGQELDREGRLGVLELEQLLGRGGLDIVEVRGSTPGGREVDNCGKTVIS